LAISTSWGLDIVDYAVAADNFYFANILQMGKNDVGGLGTGGSRNEVQSTPTPISMTGTFSGKKVKKVFAGVQQAIMITEDNLLGAWGQCRYGNCGLTPPVDYVDPQAGTQYEIVLVPSPVDTSGGLNGKKVVQVAVTYKHAVFLTEDGKLVGTGRNDKGQLLSMTGTVFVPTLMDMTPFNGQQIVEIKASRSTTFFLTSSGVLYVSVCTFY
jgi:alpha-tubulin suppressor-like RCC1 family protein